MLDKVSITLRQKILQTLSDGKAFSIHTLQETPGLKNDNLTLGVLREMEEEGLIHAEANGNSNIKA